MTSRRLELLRFRYRDALTGKWVRARYRAERRDIEERYTEFEIVGPPEIREVNPEARSFDPHFKLMTNAELRRFGEKPLELGPHLATPPAVDAVEVFLVRLFLRRYVTFCARRRRFAAMNGAARLLAEVKEPTHAPSS
jgi:hypothetical protein